MKYEAFVALSFLFPWSLAENSNDPLPAICSMTPGISFKNGYNPNLPPQMDDGSKITIFSKNYITEITEIDDQRRTIKMPILSVKGWKDPRIQINVTEQWTLLSEDFFKQCIWAPTIIFVFLEKTETWRFVKEPFVFWLDKNATVHINSYIQITLSCIMNFDWFPFDKQTCFALETSMSHGSRFVQFVGTFIFEAEIQRELQYHIHVSELSQDVKNRTMSLFGKTFSFYGWNIDLKRRLGPYVLETFLPTTVLVSTSWIAFLIPPEVVPGRMALLVTLLLVLVNIFLQVANDSPRSSTISAISTWNILCIFMVVAAIIQYGVILFIKLRDERRIKPQKSGIGERTSHMKLKSIENPDVKGRLQWIDRLSLIIFPVASIFIAFIYWTCCLRKYYGEDSAANAFPKGFGLHRN